ncbi:hypothetical protein N7453_009919 [Penicillium expansum]|nr:hypothetical protein N7453_009919 [Penicillium expansum]
MIDIKSGQKSTAIDDVVWSATTDVIAHFLERISYLGAFVAASSTFHGPTLAHGVLWHTGNSWAIGEEHLHKYDVVEIGKSIGLKRDDKPIPLPKVKGKASNGHELSAS